MAYITDLRLATVKSMLKEHINDVLLAIDSGAKLAQSLTDAQNGTTTLAWSRVLYGTADTDNSTLTVNATAKTVSCLAGAGLFSAFRVGRNVQLTNFTNAGNNQTVEIKAVTADTITLVDTSTGWVNETDTNARAQENTTIAEQDVVTAIIATRDDLTELKNALDNVAVATSDRRSVLADWVW